MAAQTTRDDLRSRAEAALEHGDFAQAVTLYQEVLPDLDAEFGLDHDAPWQARLKLGLSLYGLGRFSEAELYHCRALEGRARIFGSDHPDTLRARAWLADAVGEQGRMEEAEAIAQETIKLGEAKGLQSHDGVLMARLTVAWIRFRQERWEEAKQLATTVWADLERYVGASPRLTFSAGNLLAKSLQNTGDLNGAESRARQVYHGRRAALGEEHPHTIAIAHDLGDILVVAGKVPEASSLAAEVLPTARRVLGDGHRWTTGLREIAAKTLSVQEQS
ncbi:hypothetical protein ADK35_02220 [Streptomyces viridochromogenes]|uniref:tetratricopeptide repeat protein n=1 Tax=Streptomyces viridochromogenes TaxID=1938 RepID=UPI00069EC7E3|nr:tetratricopeptide repeat protein [Streptomyces viridochromogenes]KOG29525.1 hypothetical protein ADK35_02220 [Streptomyces viridochromogenes]